MATRIIKKNGYSHAIATARRNQRRKDAERRNVKYSALSLTEKIALAEGRRGENKRELARLRAALEAATKPATQPVKATKTKVKKAVVPA